MNYLTKNRIINLLNRIQDFEYEIESMPPSLQRDDASGELMRLYAILREERENPQNNNNTMTKPLIQTKAARLSRNSFFHVASWLSNNLHEVPSGQTAKQLAEYLSGIEALTQYIPTGGISESTTPSLIKATGYVGAPSGGQLNRKATKISRFKIGVMKFNQLKKDVDKLKDKVNNLKESVNRLITTIQKDRDLEDKAIGYESISPENEPVSSDGDPAVRDIVEVSKVRDDNDAQLDDVYPEDAPHQEDQVPLMRHIHEKEDAKKDLSKIQGEFKVDLTKAGFVGFNPSPEIQAIIAEGNEEARKLREDTETTNFPE